MYKEPKNSALAGKALPVVYGSSLCDLAFKSDRLSNFTGCCFGLQPFEQVTEAVKPGMKVPGMPETNAWSTEKLTVKRRFTPARDGGNIRVSTSC